MFNINTHKTAVQVQADKDAEFNKLIEADAHIEAMNSLADIVEFVAGLPNAPQAIKDKADLISNKRATKK